MPVPLAATRASTLTQQTMNAPPVTRCVPRARPTAPVRAARVLTVLPTSSMSRPALSHVPQDSTVTPAPSSVQPVQPGVPPVSEAPTISATAARPQASTTSSSTAQPSASPRVLMASTPTPLQNSATSVTLTVLPVLPPPTTVLPAGSHRQARTSTSASTSVSKSVR